MTSTPPSTDSRHQRLERVGPDAQQALQAAADVRGAGQHAADLLPAGQAQLVQAGGVEQPAAGHQHHAVLLPQRHQAVGHQDARGELGQELLGWAAEAPGPPAARQTPWTGTAGRPPRRRPRSSAAPRPPNSPGRSNSGPGGRLPLPATLGASCLPAIPSWIAYRSSRPVRHAAGACADFARAACGPGMTSGHSSNPINTSWASCRTVKTSWSSFWALVSSSVALVRASR